MSSQLWIHIEMSDDIKKFIISYNEVSNTPIYNYINILDKLTII
jgi:hypothetical protein